MSEATWYLRTPDETFGPETREQLITWAQLGRVQPGQEVSDDQVVWQRVEEVPFLDMRFSIDIGDGNPRGPFHRAAAEALLASGRLPPTASLVEVREPFPAEPEATDAAAIAVPSVADDETSDETPAAVAEELVSVPEPQVVTREVRVEVPVEKIVERVVEVPVEKIVEKVVEKEVFVEVPVEKIVEKEVRVEVPIEKIVEKVIVDEVRVHELEGVLEEERRHSVELRTRHEEAMRAAQVTAAAQIAEREAACAEAKTHVMALTEQVGTLESRVRELEGIHDEVQRHTTDLQTRLDESMRTASALKAQLAEAQAASAEANARAAKLAEQVIALEDELKRLPAAASEVADMQAAVFKILQDEASAITMTIAREKDEFESYRLRHQARMDKLSEQRVAIMRMSGRDVGEMTRQALASRPEDPRATRIRKEYDELKRVHEQAQLENEAKIRKLTDDLRLSRAEGLRLGESLRDVTQLQAETQQLREALQRAQKALLDERQRSEELLQREALGRQALTARLAALESPSIGTAVSMETNQSREAKQVRLPSWMKLKRA